LSEDIEHPVTGLKVQIESTETDLETNHDSQVTQTKERTESNLAYQKDIANLVEANALLTRAVAVLDKYYATITGFVQTKQTPPATFDDKYSGQSASGTSAIDMLEFILKNTVTEEMDAHGAERTAQHAFEDSMQGLTDEEAQFRESLATLKESLATKTKTLLEKEKNHRATVAEKESLEAYLVKIEPGCDFITLNIGARKTNRQTEKDALTQAKTTLKGSPAFKEFLAEAHDESLGKCLEICRPKDEAPREDHVDCKACLVDTSVPGYCAGHPGTTGC